MPEPSICLNEWVSEHWLWQRDRERSPTASGGDRKKGIWDNKSQFRNLHEFEVRGHTSRTEGKDETTWHKLQMIGHTSRLVTQAEIESEWKERRRPHGSSLGVERTEASGHSWKRQTGSDWQEVTDRKWLTGWHRQEVRDRKWQTGRDRQERSREDRQNENDND